MLYALPANNLYGNEPIALSIPDNWDVTVCEYAGVHAPAMTYPEICRAIAAPSGCKPISVAARGKQDAVIIFDDISRPTPCGDIAKAVITELEQAGVPRNNIRFMCAVGSHRAMSRDDYVRKLGEEIVQEFRVYSHNPFFNNTLVGHTSSGIPIELNADVVAAGFKVAIGNAVPHGNTGIAGGPKTILPGIASFDSIKALHSLGVTGRWDLSVAGRDMASQAAELLGLDMKIDVLLNGKGEIAVLHAGNVNALAAEHEPELRDFYRTPHEMDADIVLANNYFKPAEPFLAIAYNGIPFSVKKGGVLIVSSHTPQGAIPHYGQGTWGDTGVSGPLYSPTPAPRRCKTYYAFSTYMDKGSAAGYHLMGENFKWADKWEQILQDVGTEKRKLVIYPYGSVGFYGTSGNIEKIPSAPKSAENGTT